MSQLDIEKLPNPDDWQNIKPVWDRFIQDNPQVRISESRFACSRFMSVHGQTLVRLGVARKATRGGWIADAKNFNRVAFAVLHELLPAEQESA